MTLDGEEIATLEIPADLRLDPTPYVFDQHVVGVSEDVQGDPIIKVYEFGHLPGTKN